MEYGPNKEYDIFVSYRRQDNRGSNQGVHIARTIKQYLEISGYKGRVFFDYSEISNEDFEVKILSVIRRAKVFICVLTEDALMRCSEEGDWVGREILEAYRNKLRLIFIRPDGKEVHYPDNFPSELSFIRTRNHLTVHMDSSFESDLDKVIVSQISSILIPSDTKSQKYAKIRIRTDLDCIVKNFGEEIGSANHGSYSTIYLPLGDHLLEFCAVESGMESVFQKKEFAVEKLEYQKFIDVKLKETQAYKEIVNQKNEKEDEERMRRREKRKKRIALLLFFLLVGVVVNFINDGLQNGSTSGSGTINGHEYVDLGLPSGLKWATCNVGAETPEDYGDYYAWGETSTKSEYTKENSLTNGKSMSDISGNITYDVARTEWGSSWRLPTRSEFEKLRKKCKWIWTTQNGVWGCKVTGPNGNSIFLPAAGHRDGSSLDVAGYGGYYWSSRPYDTGNAYFLNFDTFQHRTNWLNRDLGYSVRPVSE